MKEDTKTIHVALGIGFLETVRFEEEQINPKSARSRALQNLIDHAQKICDQYQVNAWPPHKLSVAAKVLDEVEVLVKKRFEAPRRKVVRGEKGRFQSVAA